MLLVWGAVHIAGGLATIVAAPADAVASIATSAPSTDVRAEPTAVAAATLDFLMFLVGAAGVAVTAVALAVVRRRWDRGMVPLLWVIGVSDLGLILFYLLPGHMSWADGIWGPLLFVLTLAAWMVDRRLAE